MRTAGESAGVDGGVSLERVGPPVLTTSHALRIDTYSTLRIVRTLAPSGTGEAAAASRAMQLSYQALRHCHAPACL
jgi:hypothetical protein